MKINDSGLTIVKHFEGLYLRGYLCPAGVPTCCYGHTGPGVKVGKLYTVEDAERFLAEDMEKFEAAVTDLVRVVLTSDQFSALVSFAFNVGAGVLANSTLLRRLNQGRRAEASEEFLRWNKAKDPVTQNMIVLPGLTRRRKAESALFLSADWEQWLA